MLDLGLYHIYHIWDDWGKRAGSGTLVPGLREFKFKMLEIFRDKVFKI